MLNITTANPSDIKQTVDRVKQQFEEYRYLSMGVDPNDVEILSEIEGIVRTKDVIGEIDVSQLDLKGLQQLLLSQK